MRQINNFNDIDEYDFVSNRDLRISRKGKHKADFDKDLPIIIKPVHFFMDYNLIPNYHEYLEISYIIKGNGSYIVGEKSYDVKEGDIAVINNIELHTWLADHNTSMYIVLHRNQI